jgi:alpha-galactosidase
VELTGQHEIACVPVDPDRARVYSEGWQSWSVTAALPATATPYVVTSRDSLAIDCQYGLAAPRGVFQGSGLLAIDPGDGGPVEVFGTADPAREVRIIQAVLRDRQFVVSADGPVTHTADSRSGGHTAEGGDEARTAEGGDEALTGALCRWGEAFAARAGVAPGSLREIPPVWCSWYQYYGGVTEADIAGNLAAMDDLDVPVGIVQIDDGYAAAPGDWLTPSGRFRDLPGLVRRIQDSGRRAGIWIAPMLVGLASTLYAEHPDWVVRSQETGAAVFTGNVVGQECTALDLTHPDAAEYLSGVLSTMRGWGVDYFKTDFVYAGAYEGRRHEDVAGVAAYRGGLRVVRDAIGPEALLLGCGAPILPSVGLVDAMRVGPDIAATYAPADGNASMPSQRNAARNTIARAWQHGRFWVNDPDSLMLRPGVERREEWADTVERFGGLRSSGDGLAKLDAWGLETTRRLLVPSPVSPLVCPP